MQPFAGQFKGDGSVHHSISGKNPQSASTLGNLPIF